VTNDRHIEQVEQACGEIGRVEHFRRQLKHDQGGARDNGDRQRKPGPQIKKRELEKQCEIEPGEMLHIVIGRRRHRDYR
jgi:hypothetical protein